MKKKENLSDISILKTSNNANCKIGIIVSRWNEEVTNALEKGAVDTLVEGGVPKSNLLVFHVPGSFELPSAAAMLLDLKVEEGD